MAYSRLSREAAAFTFLRDAQASGIKGALLTISQIDGGAPKPIGTHMAVLEDGRHLGDVSGGCVESAIATVVSEVIASGSDRIIRFGRNSSFMDIRFPCGGAVDLLVHVSPAPELLKGALESFERRAPFAIGFDAANGRAELWKDGLPDGSSRAEIFLRQYRPRTRLLLIGRGPEFEVMARVALAAEFDLFLATPDESAARMLAATGAPVEHLKYPIRDWKPPIDPWTATVLLFHDHEQETAILAKAVAANGFYVGALGSIGTHKKRRQRLAALGVPQDLIERVRGPIGMIDRAREPGLLALSVLGEIAVARRQLELGCPD